MITAHCEPHPSIDGRGPHIAHREHQTLQQVPAIPGLDHEMRNAMMPLLLHLDLLDLVGAAAVPRMAGRVPDLVGNLHRLANGLLLRARVTSQTEPVSAVYLAAWWQAVGGMLRATLPLDGSLDLRIPSALPAVLTQPLVLGEVCLHLMMHLRLALPPHGPHRVRISARAMDTGVHVSIAEGTPRAGALAQAASTPTITPAWGLGQAHELLALSGGALRGYSSTARGTHLTIQLRTAGPSRALPPARRALGSGIADAASARSRRSAPGAAGARADHRDTSQRVLIIDDNTALTSALALRLSIEGGFETVPPMHDLHDSVARILALAPAIVLLDLNLPGTDQPLEVVRHLQELAPTTRVIILTGNPTPAAVDAARAAGAAGFIAKGVAPERLIAALRRLDEERFVLALDT